MEVLAEVVAAVPAVRTAAARGEGAAAEVSGCPHNAMSEPGIVGPHEVSCVQQSSGARVGHACGGKGDGGEDIGGSTTMFVDGDSRKGENASRSDGECQGRRGGGRSNGSGSIGRGGDTGGESKGGGPDCIGGGGGRGQGGR